MVCGFTGVISFGNINNQLVEKANKFCICRGPDNFSKTNGNDDLNFDFIFNRLAIVDLNDNANQPMYSKKYNSLIMFNGEIYNSHDLRKELINKYNFITSHSDTETLFAGLNIFGIEFIKRLEGQFAVVYWNKTKKKIYLIKDRLGQKPLFFSLSNNTLNFGSNLKSVHALNQNNSVSKEALDEYILYGVNLSPNTIFNEISKVDQGSYIEIDYEKKYFNPIKNKYWQPSSFIDDKKFSKDEFFNLFHHSVEKRLISDVPVASFLSGGLDSTSIVKSLSDLGYELNTFSVITDNSQINEKNYIDKVVQKYKTNHIEIEVGSSISNNSVYESLNSLDEPYGDPSIVPTYLLSNLISSNYKVALSGDGGDELLGGYERMLNHLKYRNKFDLISTVLYKYYPPIFGTGIKLKSRSNDYINSHIGYLIDDKFGNLLLEKKTISNKQFLSLENNLYKSIMCNEYNFYLSNQMLLKVDRASMANSLEVRSPFVDHKLVEYVFSHSIEYLDSQYPKKILSNYLSSDFDNSFLNRPKQGFIFDYKTWVYKNMPEINEIILSSELHKYYNLEKLNDLNLIKSRINALRIWRVFVLANYLLQLKST